MCWFNNKCWLIYVVYISPHKVNSWVRESVVVVVVVVVVGGGVAIDGVVAVGGLSVNEIVVI